MRCLIILLLLALRVFAGDNSREAAMQALLSGTPARDRASGLVYVVGEDACCCVEMPPHLARIDPRTGKTSFLWKSSMPLLADTFPDQTLTTFQRFVRRELRGRTLNLFEKVPDVAPRLDTAAGAVWFSFARLGHPSRTSRQTIDSFANQGMCCDGDPQSTMRCTVAGNRWELAVDPRTHEALLATYFDSEGDGCEHGPSYRLISWIVTNSDSATVHRK